MGMDVAELSKAVYRRWWIAAAVLMVTLAGTLLVIVRAETQYEATASLLLVGPEILGSGTDEMPPAETPTFTPGMVAEVVAGDETRQELDVDGDLAAYEVIVSDEGTILRVEATAETADPVVPTAVSVMEAIERTVADFQAQSQGENEPEVRFEVLSDPSLARQRTVVGPGGERQVEYVATGAVFLSIRADATPQGNPYSASEGTLRVLQEVASAPSTRAAALSGIEGADFAVAMQSRDSAPIMHVTATAGTESDTMGALDAAIGFFDQQLAERQVLTGAPEFTWIRFQRLYVPETATAVSGNLRRPLVTIIGLGIVAAVSLAVLADSVLLQRARGREDQEGAGEGDGSSRPIEEVS